MLSDYSIFVVLLSSVNSLSKSLLASYQITNNFICLALFIILIIYMHYTSSARGI